MCYHSYRDKVMVTMVMYSGEYIIGPPRQGEGDVSGGELVKNVFTAAKR